MVLQSPGQPLQRQELPIPRPDPEQVLIQVNACAVCRTDLHIIDGELSNPKLPLIPGHEIVGRIIEKGAQVESFEIGDRVGIPWLGWTCGNCHFCRTDRENLCDQARFTGYTLDGGYAEFTVADARYCFPIPEKFTDQSAAPLLCAGLIGYRSLIKAGEAERLGIYGFGASAHIITQVACYQGRKIFAFTRTGDTAAQQFARQLGACWAGNSCDLPPEKLDAIIIFAPVGNLIPQALRALEKGGRVVCGGIHMSDIPSFPYQDLWQERCICSVANLTRRDGQEFLKLAAYIPIQTEIQLFPLEAANQALAFLRSGKLQGAVVLTMDQKS